jgi:hypothetical protein
LTQSIAREFGPRGIHAAHAIIDGGIDIPLLENIQINDGAPDGKISPNAVRKPVISPSSLETDLLPDCRQLLVFAYTTSIGFYPGVRLETLR